MQIVTVNLPTIYLDAIQKLVESGIYPSRSEAMRQMIHEFLKNELGMIESLLDLAESVSKKVAVPEIKKQIIDMRVIKKGWEKK